MCSILMVVTSVSQRPNRSVQNSTAAATRWNAASQMDAGVLPICFTSRRRLAIFLRSATSVKMANSRSLIVAIKPMSLVTSRLLWILVLGPLGTDVNIDGTIKGQAGMILLRKRNASQPINTLLDYLNAPLAPTNYRTPSWKFCSNCLVAFNVIHIHAPVIITWIFKAATNP